MTAYADWLASIAPAWLQDVRSGAFLRSLGLSLDDTVARLRNAVRVRYVADAPADTLDAHARDRLLERYPAHTDATLRTYLQGAWKSWPGAGTYPGMVAALEAAGFPGCKVYDVWTAANGGTGAPRWWPGGDAAWPPSPTYDEPSWWAAYATAQSVATTWPPQASDDAGRALWSRWWLEVPALPAWSLREWGDANLWRPGDLWGVSGLSSAELDLLHRVVRKFRASAGVCELIFVRFEGDIRTTSDGDIRTTSDGDVRTTTEGTTVVLTGA